MDENLQTPPAVNTVNVVVDCPDAAALADFYRRLTGWPLTHPYTEGWAGVTAPWGMVLAFQQVEGYQPPVWPWQPGRQGQMLHLDFWVDDLEKGVAHALACGATEAAQQYYTTSRTLLDPAGHPFCIDTAWDEP